MFNEYRLTTGIGSIMNHKNILIGRIEIRYLLQSIGNIYSQNIIEQLKNYIYEFNKLAERVAAKYNCCVPYAKYICRDKKTLEQLILIVTQNYYDEIDWNRTLCGLNFYDLNLEWDLISSGIILPKTHLAIVGDTEGIKFIKDNTTYYPKANKKQENIKEMTIDEIEQILGYKVKIK
jgi:hypothetical protein